MKNINSFEQLHSEILSEIRKNGACSPGYKSVLTSDSIKEIANNIKKWWNEVLGMHLESSFYLFPKYFAQFQKEFNDNGIYFNQDASDGYAIIYNAEVTLSGTVQGRAFGMSKVDVRGSASLVSFGETKVNAYDISRVELREKSSAEMFGQCELYAYDYSQVICRGGKSLIISNHAKSEVYMCGSVHAYGEAYIVNRNPRMERRIHLYEKSSIV